MLLFKKCQAVWIVLTVSTVNSVKSVNSVVSVDSVKSVKSVDIVNSTDSVQCQQCKQCMARCYLKIWRNIFQVNRRRGGEKCTKKDSWSGIASAWAILQKYNSSLTFFLIWTGDGCNTVNCLCNIDPKTKQKYGKMVCMQTEMGCFTRKDFDDLKK